tara:strand:- start:342 stop:671 length:330 start_codon:yes stop_codon:yes gene_type:complete
MGLFDIIQAANAVDTIVSTLSEAAKVLGDKNSTPEEKKDARKAQTLGNKKVQSKKEGGAVTKMYNGGMAHGKRHMYLGGDSSVTDNAGLRALKASGPKGRAAYEKITGK